MANTINYAEKYETELLAVTNQQTLTSPFITTNVKWLNAKSFHFTSLVPTGFQRHNRSGGWNRGNVVETDHIYELKHDVDVEFLIDKADVDESNYTATIENVSMNMQLINQAPEVDARFFEQVSAAAIAAGGDYVTVNSSITADNVIETIKSAIKPVKIYRGSLMCYVNSTVMDLLEQAMIDKGRVQWTTISESPNAIETRVFQLDGTPVVEVIDDARFGTAMTYAEAGSETYGFAIDEANDRGLEICVASLATVKTVPKVSSIYFFKPGDHTKGDGYLYQNRQLWDTIVKPNGKNGLIDSVSIVVSSAAA